jgi:hypothetical protein
MLGAQVRQARERPEEFRSFGARDGLWLVERIGEDVEVVVCQAD